ncbi:SMP-30/gluconolactonase/LRE family protein [Noviherbaspirillum sp. UKPF54]|uniref:SMP-30/gluconolactonase/LRE family protein n=1 Tax=Noviherbaspirillum sp. UKPF54 TaxID=2601898 RepID=UPI0011B0F850|nr:SMP-30/gluconolactonase/LRE family protein [Noviherbaspirillum sp. UKPF54]QDZ29529.1 SMP-30/gluconolactonase/LRE family protein [Noviherbaspirillum sp. UKPF54]
MLRKTLAALFFLVLTLLAYLGLAPVPIEPVAWSAPKDAGYVGPYGVNQGLAGMQKISIGEETGPEHVAIGPDGKLYAAVAGGKILRMNADGSAREVWTNTGGRVLGFDFDARGRLIAADAMRGLLGVDAGPQHRITVLTDQVDVGGAADPIRYADAVVVAGDGKIYFTDASRRFGPAQWGGTFHASVLDIIEHSSTGRVLVYDPASGKTEVVMNDLSFANGIALSGDGQSLFVAETGEYRIWKIAADARQLSAKKINQAGGDTRARILLANLPGYPDNLMRGMNGRIWAGFAKPRGTAADDLAGKPFMRKVALRLPQALWPVPPAYGHVIAFNEAGEIVADLQDPSGSYPETTGVTETEQRLYIQSLHAPVLGWLPKDAAKL